MTPPIRYNDEPDVILVAAAQRGERDALDSLLRRHYPAVVQRCRSVLHNDADANDAAQNALVAVAKGIARFDGTSSFTTWLYRVSTNAALDEVRRRNRRPVPQLVGTDPGPSDAASDGRSPLVAPVIDWKAAERFESLVDRDAIEGALENLPPEFRAPLVLRDLCGLDYAEIAEVLAIPPGTVRSRIARGRAALAPHLQRALADSGNSDPGAESPSRAGNFSVDVKRQRSHDGH